MTNRFDTLLGHVRIGLHRDLCDSNDWNYGQRFFISEEASQQGRLFILYCELYLIINHGLFSGISSSVPYLLMKSQYS